MGKYVKTFEAYYASDREINEIFGLGKLLKSLYGKVTEPVKKKIELFSKNIDSKTGEVTDAKELANDLTSTFKEIADDKKADLRGVDSVDTVKKVLKEFFTDIKAVFSAARVPFSSMLQDVKPVKESFLNEGLQEDFSAMMSLSDSDAFEKGLDPFVDAWVEKNGGNDTKKLEAAATKFIDTMMGTFEKKISAFGTKRLKSLIALMTKNPTAKAEDVKKVISEEGENVEIDMNDGEEVETDKGKKQILDAIGKSVKDGTGVILKFPNPDDATTHNIMVTNVKW